MLTADKRKHTVQNVLRQLQQMLPGHTVADLQNMMESMDSQVYQASGGLEDAYINKMAAKLNSIKRKLAKQKEQQAQQIPPQVPPQMQPQVSGSDSGGSATRQASLSQQHQHLLTQQQQMLSQQQQHARVQQGQYTAGSVQQPSSAYGQQGYPVNNRGYGGQAAAGGQSQAMLQGQRPVQAPYQQQQRFATPQARPGQQMQQPAQQQQQYMGGRMPQQQARAAAPAQQQMSQYPAPGRVYQQPPQQQQQKALGSQQQQQWRGGAAAQQQQAGLQQPGSGGSGGLPHPVGGNSGIGDVLHGTASQDWMVDLLHEFILAPPEGSAQQSGSQQSGAQHSGAQHSGSQAQPGPAGSNPLTAAYNSNNPPQQGGYAPPAASAGYGQASYLGSQAGQPGMTQQYQPTAPSTSLAGQVPYGQQHQQANQAQQPSQQSGMGFMAMLTQTNSQQQGYQQPQGSRPMLNPQPGSMAAQQQQQQLRAQQQARGQPAGSVGSVGGSTASGAGVPAITGTAAAQQGDQTELYWEMIAKMQHDVVPALESMKQVYMMGSKQQSEGGEKHARITEKLGNIVQLLPRLKVRKGYRDLLYKIKRTDPSYANRVFTADKVADLRKIEAQLRPWCDKYMHKTQIEKKLSPGTVSASSTGAAPSSGVTSSKQLAVQLDSPAAASPPIVLSPPLADAKPVGLSLPSVALPMEMQEIQGAPQAVPVKPEELRAPQDARQRLFSAAASLSGSQSSQQSSETQQAVRQLLWQMETDAPQPPADLAMLPSTPTSGRQVLSKRSHSAAAQNFVLPAQSGSPASVLEDPWGFEIKRARSAPGMVAELEQRRSAIEAECSQALGKLSAEVAFLVAADPDVHGHILVHLSPPPLKAQGALTEQWRLLSLRVGSSYPAVAPVLLFHSTDVDGQTFFKAEAARSVFEASLSAVPLPLTIEAAANKWLEALRSVDRAYSHL